MLQIGRCDQSLEKEESESRAGASNGWAWTCGGIENSLYVLLVSSTYTKTDRLAFIYW